MNIEELSCSLSCPCAFDSKAIGSTIDCRRLEGALCMSVTTAGAGSVSFPSLHHKVCIALYSLCANNF